MDKIKTEIPGKNKSEIKGKKRKYGAFNGNGYYVTFWDIEFKFKWIIHVQCRI